MIPSSLTVTLVTAHERLTRLFILIYVIFGARGRRQAEVLNICATATCSMEPLSSLQGCELTRNQDSGTGEVVRDLFPGDFRPTATEFRLFWEEGLIVPDANVLLDLYRTSTDTAVTLLETLEAFRDRVRIPYQFALEFARNRYELLVQQVAIYRAKADDLDKLLRELKAHRGHPFLPAEHIINLERVRDAFKTEERHHRDRIDNDPMLDRIFGVSTSRVGPAPNDTMLTTWGADAKKRELAQIPPGFKDKQKGEPDCWGDYFGWRQMIEIAKSETKPLLFITGDAKEDWWWKNRGETVGPRRELVAEFVQEARVPFFMYSTDRFVELASKHLNRPVSPSTVEELAETREPTSLGNEKATFPNTPNGLAMDTQKSNILQHDKALSAEKSADPDKDILSEPKKEA